MHCNWFEIINFMYRIIYLLPAHASISSRNVFTISILTPSHDRMFCAFAYPHKWFLIQQFSNIAQKKNLQPKRVTQSLRIPNQKTAMINVADICKRKHSNVSNWCLTVIRFNWIKYIRKFQLGLSTRSVASKMCDCLTSTANWY